MYFICISPSHSSDLLLHIFFHLYFLTFSTFSHFFVAFCREWWRWTWIVKLLDLLYSTYKNILPPIYKFIKIVLLVCVYFKITTNKHAFWFGLCLPWKSFLANYPWSHWNYSLAAFDFPRVPSLNRCYQGSYFKFKGR